MNDPFYVTKDIAGTTNFGLRSCGFHWIWRIYWNKL